MEAAEKKCPQCAELVKAEAKVCRFCGHSFESDTTHGPETQETAKKAKRRGKGCLVALAIIIVLGFIGLLADTGQQAGPSANTVAGENVSTYADETSSTPTSTAVPEAAAEVPDNNITAGLFGPQANAARSAQQYLNMTGFSRQGLIEQLSSGAGEGYDVADATAAVDSMTVDWNEQAVRSAEQYLQMTGFSCSGLIEQLSSDAGSKYTRAQARYGAEKAGAC